MKVIICGLISAAFLGGCASNISPNTYSVGSIGQVERAITGVIISARSVNIEGTSDLGSTAGGAAGAVAGSSIGSNVRDSLVGAIGGAVVGGLAGAAIEGVATKQKGFEYVVKTENDNLMTLVQGSDVVFKVGQKVIVLYGHPARIIADTSAR